MALLEKLKSGTRKAVMTAALVLIPITIPGCYSLQNTPSNDDLYYSPKKAKIENTQGITNTVQVQDAVSQKSQSFIGTPVSLNQNTKDLDFILESYDVDANKKYTINVYEKWDESNSANLDMVKNWVVDALNDSVAEFRIEGFYTKSTLKDNVETGKLDPFAVIHVAKTLKNGKMETSEEVAFTDKKDSKIYTKEYADVIFDDVYRPGQMIHSVHYPFGFSPYWDSDGDGIPNAWDPWPYTFGPWVDVNNNGIWDWYDPGYGSRYWGYWDNYYYDHPSVIVVWHDYYNHHHDHDNNRGHHRFYDDYMDHGRQHDRIMPRNHNRDDFRKDNRYSSGNIRQNDNSRMNNTGNRRDNSNQINPNNRTYNPVYTRPVQKDQNSNQGTRRNSTDQNNNRTYTRPTNSNNNNSSTTQPRRESNTNNNRTYTPSNNTRTYNQSENNRTYTRPSNSNNNGSSSRTYTPSNSGSSGSTYSPSSSSGSSSRSYSSGSSGSSSSSSGSSSSSSGRRR